ncbi:hypothetical protein MTO96_018202 [Rhipicephalus appendiculatus]
MEDVYAYDPTPFSLRIRYTTIPILTLNSGIRNQRGDGFSPFSARNPLRALCFVLLVLSSRGATLGRRGETTGPTKLNFGTIRLSSLKPLRRADTT